MDLPPYLPPLQDRGPAPSVPSLLRVAGMNDEVQTHLLADVVSCGPGELAIQWSCACGAWGKPVPVTSDTSRYGRAGAKVLAGYRRHANRSKARP